MIKTSQLNKSVKTAEADLEILRGIDLEIKRGETAAIVGTSGSGKSTLLGLLAGLDSPSGGDIYLDDTNIVQLDEDERATLRSQKVGFVFQSFQLLPALTALENVMLPLELAGRDDARVMAEDYLARVGLGDVYTITLEHFQVESSSALLSLVLSLQSRLFFLRMNPPVTLIRRRALRLLSCCLGSTRRRARRSFS